FFLPDSRSRWRAAELRSCRDGSQLCPLVGPRDRRLHRSDVDRHWFAPTPERPALKCRVGDLRHASAEERGAEFTPEQPSLLRNGRPAGRGPGRPAVAADVPPGTDDARLAGKWGITNPRLFAVSQGLTEVAVQPQKEPDAAQTVPLNCVVNGNSRQGREDVFRFLAKKGQRVVVECFARRLDSQLDGVLVLTDDDGRQLASNGDYAGRDPLVEFVVTKDGDYRVALNDLTYRGGQPYRLVISDLPHVENVFPRAVRAGQPARLTVYGRNLGSGAKPSPFVVNDLPLDTITESVTVPEDVLTARTKDAPLQRLNMFGALPMRQSDTFRIEIEVNPTAYVYVIWVDPGHDVTPVYPWNPREGWGTRPATEEPIGRLSLPRDAA